MSIFENECYEEHEKILFINDAPVGLKAIIAIHNTNRGPSLGGCRFFCYETEEDAINDVLKLSKAMSYKAAIMDLPYGGGKSVIIGSPRNLKSRDLLIAFGCAVDSLMGEYIVSEDIGMNTEDMDVLWEVTPHVAGTTEQGNPAKATAYGLMQGIFASMNYKFGNPSISGKLVAVEGLGNVGYRVCEYLTMHGARLAVSDTNKIKTERVKNDFPDVTVVSPRDIHKLSATIYCPCAVGGTLNERTIPELQCDIVAGSANNQLGYFYAAEELRKKNILYAPDYVINAGGLVYATAILEGKDFYSVTPKLDSIGVILHDIYERAEKLEAPTQDIADDMAADRIYG